MRPNYPHLVIPIACSQPLSPLYIGNIIVPQLITPGIDLIIPSRKLNNTITVLVSPMAPQIARLKHELFNKIIKFKFSGIIKPISESNVYNIHRNTLKALHLPIILLDF